MDRVPRTGKSDQQRPIRGCSYSDRRRKHEDGRRDRGAVWILTTGHAAMRHGAHRVAAIHGVLGTGWRLRVMMPVNRTLRS